MNRAPLPVLGLIGGIGAGKSAAAAAFARRGGAVLDCDRLGHAALAQPDLLARLVARWGPGVVTPEGAPDRRVIGGIVFADAGERAFLEGLMFPAIGALVQAGMASAAGDPAVRFVVLDAAVLLEAGWGDRCDRIVYVDAPRAARLARVLARSGWSAEEVARREAAQWPATERRARADAVLSNGGAPEKLRMQADRLLEDWGWADVREGHDV